MGISLTEVKFDVEDNSWVNKTEYKLHGRIKAQIWLKLGTVLNDDVEFFKEMEFIPSKLPAEIQEKLVEVHKDIQKFLDENHEFKIRD